MVSLSRSERPDRWMGALHGVSPPAALVLALVAASLPPVASSVKTELRGVSPPATLVLALVASSLPLVASSVKTELVRRQDRADGGIEPLVRQDHPVPTTANAAPAAGDPNDKALDKDDNLGAVFSQWPEWRYLFLECAEHHLDEVCKMESASRIDSLLSDEKCADFDEVLPLHPGYFEVLDELCKERISKDVLEAEIHHSVFQKCLTGIEMSKKIRACCDEDFNDVLERCGDPTALPELAVLSRTERAAIGSTKLLVWCETDKDKLSWTNCASSTLLNMAKEAFMRHLNGKPYTG